jgi:ribosome-binding factor A
MPQYRRTDRLNEQLRQEITLLLRDSVRDPRVALATITAVQTSPELDHAKVYFTALGDDDDRKEVQAGLRSAAAFLRRELGKRLHIRRVPELHFAVDRVMEEAQRIERLLHEALPRDPIPADDEDVDDSSSSLESSADDGEEGGSSALDGSADDERAAGEVSPSASDGRPAAED